MVGGGEEATIKVTGGDEDKSQNDSKLCYSGKVVGGDDRTTIKVTGGDDEEESKSKNDSKRYSSREVAGEEDRTTIKVTGGDDEEESKSKNDSKRYSSRKVAGEEDIPTIKVTGGSDDSERVDIGNVVTKIDDKKRKRVKETTDAPKEDKKKDYIIKYVGETSRSGYERGKEHFNAFRDLNEQSHMLKHFLLAHEGMQMKDVKFGMRITGTYRSAIERQIAEAVKIEREVLQGKKLMNSKSEFNRCELPRLNAGTRKEALETLRAEDDETKMLNRKLRMIRKRKKDKKIEDEMKNPTLERVCQEILNEDNRA